MRRRAILICTLALLLAAEPRAELRQTLNGHSRCVYHAVFRPDGKRLASSSKDKSVKLWDADSGKEIRTLRGHSGEVYSSAFSPDGKQLATASEDRTVKLWDADSGEELRTFQGHKGDVYNVAFSPDGRTLASASQDQTVRLWDIDTGKMIKILSGHTARVCTAAFSPDGRRVAASSPSTPAPDSENASGQVILWDAASGKEVLSFAVRDAGVLALAFSPDGRRLAGACLDKTVKVWELATGREALCMKGHTLPVYHVAFRPDGRALASCSGDWSKRDSGEVKLWALPSGRETLSFRPHTLPIWSVAFHAEGRRLATTAGLYTLKQGEPETPGEIKIWELRNLPPPPHSPAPTAEQLETLWEELAGTNGAQAYRAVWTLSDAPKQAVPFLSRRVHPPQARDLDKEVADLLRKLDDDNFAVREAAAASLELLGRVARPALLKARQAPSLEVRRRVALLLEKKDEGLPPLSAEERRGLRVVEVLLRIGTAEARAVLRKLASGEAKATVTQEAAAALEWLNTR
jgi:WD40 repeat protein